MVHLRPKLTEETFLEFCMHNYSHPGCSLDDFLDDINKIVLIKKMLNKIAEGREINLRLLLNHIVILNNTFGIDAAKEILEFKIDDSKRVLLNTFLHHLNVEYDDEDIDLALKQKLEEITK